MIPGIVLQSELPPLTQPVIALTATLYFVVVMAIGAWASRRIRTSRDFFVAGRGIGIVALTLSAMSATLSGFAFIGGPGLMYSIGLGAMYIMLSASMTGAMGAWVLAKRMRVLGELQGLITVPDAIGARYGSRLAQGLAGVAILVGVIGYMATNVLALGLVIHSIFGIGVPAGIWTGTVITLGYSMAGGIVAGIYTDVFQGALMAVASVLVFAATLDAGGGLPAISRTIMAADPGFLGAWGSLTPLTALSFFFVFGVGSLGQPHVIHKFYMLKDPRRLKWFPLLMTASMLVTTLLFFGVGIVVKALVARGEIMPLDSADLATPTFLLRFTPVVLAGIVFSGVAAAIMSTVNSFMNIGAAVITHDLPVAFGRSIRRELFWGRVWTLGISVVAGVVAQLSGTLVAFLGIFGFGLFASTIVPALAIGLNWAGATRQGAVASIAVGLAVTIFGETLGYLRLYSLPTGVTVSGLSLVLSFLVFFAVSWLTCPAGEPPLDPDVRLAMDV